MSRMTYPHLYRKFLQLLEANDLEGLRFLLSLIDRHFPEQKDISISLNVYLLSQEEDDEKACDLLDEALQHGVWWHPSTLDRSPFFKPLHSCKRFSIIREKNQQLFEKNRSFGIAKILYAGDETSSKGIFAIHWRGSNAEDFSTFWLEHHSPYRFAFPQSSQVHGIRSFHWDDEVIAKNELKELFQRFVNDSRLSTRNMVISGASQGGKLAIEQLLAGQIFKARGFIAVIPAIIPHTIETIKRLLQNNNWKQMKGCIITGTGDPFYEETMKLKPLFEQYQFPCLWLVVEGLGHMIPENFQELIEKATDFIFST
ncbi:MAG: hypothetical protein H0Z31_05565 [Bacillus sp. (in: Bacteria)]|nr:hypothetical protein [Bacillus sp. (in: firmicutes)]